MDWYTRDNGKKARFLEYEEVETEKSRSRMASNSQDLADDLDSQAVNAINKLDAAME